jgi:diguanylate cyclase (GGDEF)-like protein
MRADLKDRLERCRTLPTLPALALKVLELCQKEDLNLNEIASVIGSDPALAAKLLRMANSPVSGLKRPARTVSHALALLGVNTVRTLALSFSLASDMKKSGSGLKQGVWKRSILAAISAREVARVVESRLAEESFLAALLQDIGALALSQVEPKICAANWEKAKGDHTLLIDLEREAFGTDHAEITKWLLTRWKLPGLFGDAAGTSHTVVEAGQDARGDSAQIEKIVRLSGWVADIWIREDAAAAIETARIRAHSILGLTEERLAPILKEIATAMTGEVAQLFEVDVGSADDIQAILEQAKEALVVATFRADQEADEARQSATELEQKNRELAEESQTDKLTRLANRDRCDRYLNEQFQLAQVKGKPLSVLFCDVDFFKKVNDGYGHAVGDVVLVTVAGLLSQRMRGTDLVARYGGEEFVILLPDTPSVGAKVVADRLRARIEAAAIEYGGEKPMNVTISIGSASFEPGSPFTTPLQLVKAADDALYAAKRGGRNRVVDAAELAASGNGASATV